MLSIQNSLLKLTFVDILNLFLNLQNLIKQENSSFQEIVKLMNNQPYVDLLFTDTLQLQSKNDMIQFYQNNDKLDNNNNNSINQQLYQNESQFKSEKQLIVDINKTIKINTKKGQVQEREIQLQDCKRSEINSFAKSIIEIDGVRINEKDDKEIINNMRIAQQMSDSFEFDNQNDIMNFENDPVQNFRDSRLLSINQKQINVIPRQINNIQFKSITSSQTDERMTIQIEKYQNNVTQILSGEPQLKQLDYKLQAKAIHQSSDLIVLIFNQDLKEGSIKQKHMEDNLSRQSSVKDYDMKMYKSISMESTQNYHTDRPHLFSSDCQTIVTQNGQIFVMGGKFIIQKFTKGILYFTFYYRSTYYKTNIEFILDIFKDGPNSNKYFRNIKTPIAFKYMKNTGFYYPVKRSDMPFEKIHFGICCKMNNGKIYIAGGQNQKQSELDSVESYDISTDTWRKLPKLNKKRQSPSICEFKQRFLYVFGGIQFDQENRDERNNQSNQHIKEESDHEIIGYSFVKETEKLDLREGNKWEVINLKNNYDQTYSKNTTKIIIIFINQTLTIIVYVLGFQLSSYQISQNSH